jgi:hypothetical protein
MMTSHAGISNKGRAGDVSVLICHIIIVMVGDYGVQMAFDPALVCKMFAKKERVSAVAF